MSPRVLLVDDDPSVLEVFLVALRQKGYLVLGAGSAEEALRMLETEGVDAVVTDVAMPSMSGLRLLEVIRATRPTLPVILCSGLLTEDFVEGARAAGASAVLDKPLRRRELARAIDQAVHAPATPGG